MSLYLISGSRRGDPEGRGSGKPHLDGVNPAESSSLRLREPRYGNVPSGTESSFEHVRLTGLSGIMARLDRSEWPSMYPRTILSMLPPLLGPVFLIFDRGACACGVTKLGNNGDDYGVSCSCRYAYQTTTSYGGLYVYFSASPIGADGLGSRRERSMLQRI